jgi:hypothetical protein
MERDLWMMANIQIKSLLDNIIFSGVLTQFNLFQLMHERKRAKLGGDYENIKMICKL